jgi:hypothetical protein
MNQDSSEPTTPTNRQVMPAPSPTAQAMKGMDPEAVLANMPAELAITIVSEWRQARQAPGLPAAGGSTISQYTANAERLERKYSDEYNVEYGLLNPIDFAKALFLHAQELSPSSWNLYRHSVLHVMNARGAELEAKGFPQKSLFTAMAALIVATKKPGSPKPGTTEILGLIAPKKAISRPKSITHKYFVALVTQLATAFPAVNLSARRAQSFAMATLATGLRPAEWLQAELRKPMDQELENLGPDNGWLALDVVTAKRKDNEEEWIRTLLIPPGPYQNHIRQHYEAFKSYVGDSKAQETPEKLYIRQCSTVMTTACQQLWPKNPERRFTLKTLRSQARANFASKHGAHIAAAMLGHSPETSMSYYAGKQRANLLRRPGISSYGDLPVPVPGKNVMEKANEFIRREQANMQRAAQAQENRSEKTSEEPKA